MPRADAVLRARGWVFTVNNPTDADTGAIGDLAPGRAQYVCYGRELGESGTPHLQGYVHFKNAHTRRAVVRLLGGRAYVEQRRGSVAEAVKYCKKQTGEANPFFESGSCPAQGARVDLEQIRQRILAGATDEEIADADFARWVVYRRSFNAYRQLKSRPTPRGAPTIHIWWGVSGAGKSKRCADDFPSAYWLARPNCNTVWWDGYTGQDVVVIDDFYGWVPYDLLLRVCDRHPLMVRTQQGYVPFAAHTIVFTSNKPWSDWYPNLADTTAFARRVREFGHVVHYDRLNERDST